MFVVFIRVVWKKVAKFSLNIFIDLHHLNSFCCRYQQLSHKSWAIMAKQNHMNITSVAQLMTIMWCGRSMIQRVEIDHDGTKLTLACFWKLKNGKTWWQCWWWLSTYVFNLNFFIIYSCVYLVTKRHWTVKATRGHSRCHVWFQKPDK